MVRSQVDTYDKGDRNREGDTGDKVGLVLPFSPSHIITSSHMLALVAIVTFSPCHHCHLLLSLALPLHLLFPFAYFSPYRLLSPLTALGTH